MTNERQELRFRFMYLISWYGLPPHIENAWASRKDPFQPFPYEKFNLIPLIFSQPSPFIINDETNIQESQVDVSNPNNFDVGIAKVFAINSNNNRILNLICKFSSGVDETVIKKGSSETLKLELFPSPENIKEIKEQIQELTNRFNDQLDQVKQKAKEVIQKTTDQIKREAKETIQKMSDETDQQLTNIKESTEEFLQEIIEYKSDEIVKEKMEIQEALKPFQKLFKIIEKQEKDK